MIGYHLSNRATSQSQGGNLLDYTLAGNGVFLEAERENLSARIQIARCEVRGLPPLDSYCRLPEPIPANYLNHMLARSRQTCEQYPQEILFHLLYSASGWEIVEPVQEATVTSVRPLPDAQSTRLALVEVHSHHSMKAYFSSTDTEDERQGFRIYGVIGTIFTRPQIALRLGIHGHFGPLSIRDIFA